MSHTVLITGASNGIGMELARIFATHHTNVILVARNGDKLKQLANELMQKYAVEAYWFVADLSDMIQLENVYFQIQSLPLKVTYLVNNAGFGNWGDFSETDWKKEHQMIELNISALTYFTKIYAKEMRERKFGKILNLASMAAFQPGPLMAVYYATKAYVLSLSEAVNYELKGTGVTLTTLCPGPTDTGFVKVAALEDSKLFSDKKLPTAAEVALFGYNAMMKGKSVVVPGFMNRIMVLGSSLAPRSIAMSIVEKMQRSKK